MIGKRQIEQLAAQAAADIDAFYAEQLPGAVPPPPPCRDAKGIAMRPEALRPATAKATARARTTFRTRPASGEKPARKRMATLGVVYDAEPAPRRPPRRDRRPRRTRRAAPAALQATRDAQVTGRARSSLILMP
ncbi:hypothetical protein [Nonomuraea jabiensis]|uniref:hypothetical protein n=1 Tax=Nonomuraea jabiensis TaxID=882448 RepID=UPI003D72B122